MEFLVIVGLIFWVISAAAKRQQDKRAKEAAELRARQAAASMAQPAETTAHAAPRAPLTPNVHTPVPNRMEARHPLEPSGYTGHAHMETSMTGIESCPPQQAPVAASSGRWRCISCGARMSDGQFCEVCGAKRPAVASARPAQKRPVQQKQPATAPQRAPLHAAMQTVHEDSNVPVSVELDAHAPVFQWDANRVRDGLLYAEILGAPRAKRPLYPARRP